MSNTQTPSPSIVSDSPTRPADGRAGIPAGWRHGAVWTYLVMLLASAAALVASLVLSADTLQLARHPESKLGCDINATLSCSAVAESWQAEIIKIGGLSYPNAFLGIAAESVFVTVAVIGMAKVAVPRWFAACTWLGGLAALAYAYWLTSQSLFVIEALCPWCLVLMASTTIQFMALSHATVTVQALPSGRGAAGLRTYYRLGFDLMVDLVWIVAVATVILVKDGPALFL
ncbi:vitamin K epoxide reductase family protein [Bifidobacterium pullorum subsp. saeculare]|uniref:Vitamin K epoxide reductase family protein n=1 Tax=Bifidobacterium pullorum subsp. saeculare TaxID=78257 RepID=A0A938WVY1_9BIFI|nr:vitamin K epoxide reductase family protein [Bifidobacterium pullorum]MBM6698896.1 vitamin K epoxide reductase family protein [Bifidobacterium pullorum subsp. saeculare]